MLSHNEMSRKEMSFSTQVLLEKIKTNRQKHCLEYDEAVIEYKNKLGAVLTSRLHALNNAKAGEVPKGSVTVPEPTCYLAEYDQFIDMLEMTKDETISLSMAMFNQLVRDQWDWKQTFEMTKASYLLK